MRNLTRYSPFFNRTQFWLEYIQLSSWFKFSFQKLRELTLQLPVITFPKQVSILTCFHFRKNIKRGGGKKKRPRFSPKHVVTPSRQAEQGYIWVSFNFFTYPKKARCRARPCHSRRHRERCVWLCWLLSWLRVPSLLPSGWLGTFSLSQNSGFPLLLWYQYFNCSQTAPWALPPPLSYLQLQFSIMNHFRSTSCSLSLSKGKIAHKIVAVSYVFLWPEGKASGDHRTYRPCCL